MTVQEEVRQRIERDVLLAKLRKKIDSGKADFNDTFLYSDRAGKLLGDIFAQRLPDIPIAEREVLCVELLRDRYTDINALCDAVQRALDKANGLHLKPQRAPFEEARAHLIGHSTADQTVSVETQQRRGRSATATMTRSMHDDRMKAEAKFRSGAGLQCYITRKTDGKCCEWCSAIAGRYEYYSEPKDVYRRHDNCGCSVTYENGRKRQDVWSKRIWEAPEPGAGAGDPVVFTKEQAVAAGAGAVHRMSSRSSNNPIDAQPIQNSKKELLALAKYARDRGIEYHNPMDFDGDIKLMMRQIDAIASIRAEYKITHKLTICTSTILEGDLGKTAEDGRTITLNISALRDLKKTNDYLNSDNWFSSTTDIGISIHEMGHVIHKQYGGIGLDIARKTCYNLTGKQMEYQEVIEYLFSSMSEYSIFLYPNQRDKPFSPKLYREIIPEVLAKHATNPDDFTAEFVRIMKEGCGL